METQTKYQPRVEKIERVWTPDAKLWTPHEDREIAFASPAFGQDTYKNVGQAILSKNLDVPTGDYTASLLHAAYCTDASKIQEFKNVRDIMRINWFWVFNQNLWAENGVYVVSDTGAVGRSQPLDVNELEKKLVEGKEMNGVRFSADGKVRFAPRGSYSLGENTSESFAKDGFIIASSGKEGAEKLGEVSAEFKNNPYIYGSEVQKGQTPELRVSAVGEVDGRLWFGGLWGVDYRCRAFGVLK